jgi:hypothetical protein
MPPAKRTQEDPNTLKEKLHSLQGTNARGRRNGASNLANGSHLKEVMSSTADNISTNSGQNDHNSSSGVSHRSAYCHFAHITDLRALHRWHGRNKTAPSSKVTDEPTASTPRPRSRTLLVTLCSAMASDAFHLQWHGRRQSGECRRSSWLWL